LFKAFVGVLSFLLKALFKGDPIKKKEIGTGRRGRRGSLSFYIKAF